MRRPASTSGSFAAALALAGCASAPKPAPLPDPAAARRFEIVAVGDTTFRFLAGGIRWVRAGGAGLVVDPRRRDALVAEYVIQRRGGDTVDAVVTGQTARVALGHVALLDAPRVRLVRQRSFWLGIATGGVLGTLAGLVAH